jgi:large subunit ribosomal protein L35
MAAMPKMKTVKSIKKRFRVTAKGKLKRRQAGKKHLESHKTGKRKRQLRRPLTQETAIPKKYVMLMGGGA